MGWRIIKGEWKHLLLWGWTAFYFIWQSLQFNPTMRYQLPIYPLLCMMAAWFFFELPKIKKTTDDQTTDLVSRPLSIVSAVVGVTVLILTAVWAFAFHSIYLRDETRIAASRWIFQNVPGRSMCIIETADNGIYNQPLPVPVDMVIPAGDAIYTSVLSQIQRTSFRGCARVMPGFSDFTLDHCADPVFRFCSGSLLAIAQNWWILSQPMTRADPLLLFHLIASPGHKGSALFFEDRNIGQRSVLSGSYIANETDYDWGLPFRIDGFDAFGGIYRGDLDLACLLG